MVNHSYDIKNKKIYKDYIYQIEYIYKVFYYIKKDKIIIEKYIDM